MNKGRTMIQPICSRLSRFAVREPRPAVPETDVTRMWLARARPDVEFLSECGRRIRIIDPGIRNLHDGPDFLGAVVTVDGALRRGAIEVHTRSEDWLRHGHGQDPRYAQVVLHVCLYGGSAPRGIPTINLADQLGESLRAAWDTARGGRQVLACLRAQPGRNPAAGSVPGGGSAPRAAILRAPVAAMTVLAAARRFEKKLQRASLRFDVLRRECGEAHGFRQLMYEQVARAAGYGGNERQFEALARAVPLRLIASSPASARLTRLLQTAGQGAARQEWNSCAVMPHNRAGNRLRWFAAWAPQLDEPAWWRQLFAVVRRGVFEAREFAPLFQIAQLRENPGPDRVAEIAINVFAPSLRLYAQRKGDRALARAALRLYVAFTPAPPNRHTRLLAGAFEFDSGRGERQQGMIELATEFCDNQRCAQCLVSNC
jgi:hypothetical protein